MVAPVFFTPNDRMVVSRAASLAERLTLDYFGLPQDQWRRSPYGIFTRREVGVGLCVSDVFAHVIIYGANTNAEPGDKQSGRFGIVLQDPNILLALLRSAGHDLWTLSLFVLTHELSHIVRFKNFGVDFFASEDERDREEQFVTRVTEEILRGVANTNGLLKLYEKGPMESKNYFQWSMALRIDGGLVNADL
jgi:hypothetical protein